VTAIPTAAVPATRGPLPVGAVMLGFMATGTVIGARSAFSVLYPTMVADAGWSVAELTATYSAAMFVYTPMVIISGFAIDRFGCRLTMIAGGIALIVGNVIVSSSHDLFGLLVGYGISAGAGSALCGFVPSMRMLAIRAPGRFAAAFGLAYVGQGVAALVISPVTQAMIDAWDWRIANHLNTVLGAVLLVLAAWLAPGPESRRGISGERGSNVLRELFTLKYVIFFLGNVTVGYQMLFPTHQVAHLQEAGFAALVAASIGGVYGFMSAVGGGIGGFVQERLGGTRLMLVAAAIATAGGISLVYAVPEAGWLVGIFLIGSGLSRGFQSVVLVAGQTRAFAGPTLGRMTGLLDVGFGVGAFLGQWGTAAIHDTGSGYAPGIFTGVLASLMLLALMLAARRYTGAGP
jgi:predicted MFS family arabinose efflux permease